jgi:hypothetical protein
LGCPIRHARVGGWEPLPVNNRVLVFATIATIGLVGARSAYADPGFTIDAPSSPPKTGQLIKFTATTVASDYSWDLNGDGIYGDKTGNPVTWSYNQPGPVNVGVRAPDESNQSVQTVQIDGPPATFVTFPPAPLAGDPVTFVYSSTQATPVDSPPAWDLNGDGQYGDAYGSTASRTFPAPGLYAVGLEVTDLDGAISTSTQLISVHAPPSGSRSGRQQIGLMSPFPVVRISGRVSSKGARIKHLTIRAPFGSTVMIRCRGRGCPFRRRNQTLALAGAKTPSKTIRVKKLEHRLLRGGASLKILITRQGEIGKYTRFKIVTGKVPIRTDLCLVPGSTKPEECPST